MRLPTNLILKTFNDGVGLDWVKSQQFRPGSIFDSLSFLAYPSVPQILSTTYYIQCFPGATFRTKGFGLYIR